MPEVEPDDDIEIQEFRFVIAIDHKLEEAAAAEEAAIAAGVDPGANHGAIARLKKVKAENAVLEARIEPYRLPVRKRV